MISGLINAFSTAGLCTTRAFLPAFLVSLGLRVVLTVQTIHDTQAGLLADVMHAETPWFTSTPFIVIVGLLATMELISTKVPEVRDLLREFDVAIKPIMAGLTTFGIVSATDVEVANTTLAVHPAGVLTTMLFPALAAGMALGGTWFRTELYEIFDAIDSDDSLGLQKALSWLEESWVIVGVVMMFVIPILLLLTIGIAFLVLAAVEHRMKKRIRSLERPCPTCGHSTHPSAVYCAECHAVQPDPVDVGFFGLPKLSRPANPKDHRFRLLRYGRCPSCADPLESRSVTQECGACGMVPIESIDHAQAYVDWNSERERKVLLSCFGLGLIPYLGVIPAVVYYRLSLVAPYRRYLPRWRSMGAKMLARVASFMLIMLQWIPVIGWISLPLMGLLNHRLFRASFMKACRKGIEVKSRPPLALPSWLQKLRGMIPTVKVRGWQLGAGLIAASLLLWLWPSGSEAASPATYGEEPCPDLGYQLSGTWTSRLFTETYGRAGTYRLVMKNPVRSNDKPWVDMQGSYILDGDALSLSLGRASRQYQMLLTAGNRLLYVAPSGTVSRYLRQGNAPRVPEQCQWSSSDADGDWMNSAGSEELVVRGTQAAFTQAGSRRLGELAWRGQGEASVTLEDGEELTVYFGVDKHQVLVLSSSSAEASSYIDTSIGTLMVPAATARADAAARREFVNSLADGPEGSSSAPAATARANATAQREFVGSLGDRLEGSPSAPAPAALRSMEAIVRAPTPADAADRFVWVVTHDGRPTTVQVHCGEHAAEAARRAAGIMVSEGFMCREETCFQDHDGIGQVSLYTRRDADSRPRLVAFWRHEAGDDAPPLEEWRASLPCGQVAHPETTTEFSGAPAAEARPGSAHALGQAASGGLELAHQALNWARIAPEARPVTNLGARTDGMGLAPTVVRSTVRANVHASPSGRSPTVRVMPADGLLVALEGSYRGQPSSLDPDGASRMTFVVISETVSGWVSNRLIRPYERCMAGSAPLAERVGDSWSSALEDDFFVSQTRVYVDGQRKRVVVMFANDVSHERSYIGVFLLESRCRVGRELAFLGFDGLIDESLLTDTAGAGRQSLLLVGTRPHADPPAGGVIAWRGFQWGSEQAVWTRALRTGALAAGRRVSIGGTRDRLLRGTHGYVLGVRSGRGADATVYYSWTDGRLVDGDGR